MGFRWGFACSRAGFVLQSGCMDTKTKKLIKETIQNSILDYVSNFDGKTKQPLDILIPKERAIRSIVGGLETSMGTRVWEPIAKALAETNGFEVIEEKILRPKPFPEALSVELSRLIEMREDKATWVSAKECKKRIKAVVLKLGIDPDSIEYVAPPAGTGVDIRLKKEGTEYAFDTKTVQPNVGSIKSFNKQILEWYAYSIFRDPDIDIVCRIAYPYNPHEKDFWTYAPHNGGILEPSIDAVVENEFWDFLSGEKNTFQEIEKCFNELNKEGFGKEISELIENKNK